MSRTPVAKTYKLYLGGAYARSESGRTYAAGGVEVPQGSRKDVRDAVSAARGAFASWSARTAYNRGQILYRCAEALESRSRELAARCSGGDAEVAAAVDLLVHHAGWTDKLGHVLGAVNPVAAPYFSFTTPEPTGVVAVLCPDAPSLLGCVAELAAALAGGNVCVVALSESAPLAGLDLGEVLGVSDVPAGVVNLLSGRRDELVAALCAHRDVNAIVDATGEPARAVAVDEVAAETVKRVSRPGAVDVASPEAGAFERISALLELKTAWHPVGV